MSVASLQALWALQKSKENNNKNTYVVLDYQKNRFDPFRPTLIHQYKFNGKFITYNDYIENLEYFDASNQNKNNYIFIFPGFSYTAGLNTVLLQSNLPKLKFNNFKNINIIKDMNERVLYYVFFISITNFDTSDLLLGFS